MTSKPFGKEITKLLAQPVLNYAQACKVILQSRHLHRTAAMSKPTPVSETEML